MTRPKVIGVGALLVCVACNMQDTLQIDPPEQGELKSVLLLFEQPEATFLFHTMLDPEQPIVVPIGIDPNSPLYVEAFVPSERLGLLPQGLLEEGVDWRTRSPGLGDAWHKMGPGNSYAVPSGPVPRHITQWGAPKTARLPSLWFPRRCLDDKGTAVIDDGIVQCTLPDLCLRFARLVVTLPEATQIQSLVRLDDTSVLVGDGSRTFWRVHIDGSFERLEQLDNLPSVSGFRDPDGVFWFGGGRDLIHGPLDGPFTVETLPGEGFVNVNSIRRDPVSGLIFAAGFVAETDAFRIVVWRRDGQAWTEVGSVESGIEYDDEHIQLRWVGDGQALVTYGGPHLLYYDGNALLSLYMDPGVTYGAALTDIARHPEHGVVLSSELGLYRSEAPFRDWIPLDQVEFEVVGSAPESIIPYAHGYVFGGKAGVVGQYYPGGRPCDTEWGYIDSTASYLVQVGEAIVSSGTPRLGLQSSVTWLTPVP